MRIAHVTGSLSTQGGGVSLAVTELAHALQHQGCDVDLHGLADEGDLFPQTESLRPFLHPLSGRRPWPRSRQLRSAVGRSSANVLHTHGLWTDASVAVHRARQQRGLPYVVSPHGMLDAWALRNSAWKKRIAAALFESRHLRSASVVHALCQPERQAIRHHGLANPVAVIPNGVSLPAFDAPKPAAKSTKSLLFLGRLHPKKGLAELLDAWATLVARAAHGRPGWHLVIAGWGEDAYSAELIRRCRDAGLDVSETTVAEYLRQIRRDTSTIAPGSVVFVGSAFGDEKNQVLKRADAFTLPSFSEGLPMAVLEAWAYGLPVVMTDHCNLPEGFACDAGIRIKPEVRSIQDGLELLIEMTDKQRKGMGLTGRRLVEQRFTWTSVAAQMSELYRWVLGDAAKPSFIK